MVIAAWLQGLGLEKYEPGGGFGTHQLAEQMSDTLCLLPLGSGSSMSLIHLFRPKSAVSSQAGRRPPEPQSNDVDLEDRGLICLADRNAGFDIWSLHL